MFFKVAALLVDRCMCVDGVADGIPVHVDGKNSRLISRLAELSRKVKNTANIRLSAKVFDWCSDQRSYRMTEPSVILMRKHAANCSNQVTTVPKSKLLPTHKQKHYFVVSALFRYRMKWYRMNFKLSRMWFSPCNKDKNSNIRIFFGGFLVYTAHRRLPLRFLRESMLLPTAVVAGPVGLSVSLCFKLNTFSLLPVLCAPSCICPCKAVVVRRVLWSY